MHLGVLDQIIPFDRENNSAWDECIGLFDEARAVGYSRFWVAEHHGPNNFCGSPEVLVGALSSRLDAADSIRVGTGSILVPFYKPKKIAETAGVLSMVTKGRFDLGLGKGPGATTQVQIELGYAGQDSMESKVEEILGLLAEEKLIDALDIWITGSSLPSALMAARLGVKFCAAHFLTGSDCGTLFSAYRENFTVRDFMFSGPYTALAVRVYTSDDASELAGLENLARWRFDLDGKLPSRWSDLCCRPRIERPLSMPVVLGPSPRVAEDLGFILSMGCPDELIVVCTGPPLENKVEALRCCGKFFL